jgi:RNA polymerase sigma-70 factor (ECF subfamily)
MNVSPTTRYSLLLRIQDPQDQAAWSEFVTIYEPLVYRLARHKGLQDADAHDLCQDVFRAVAQAARRWVPDPAKGSFRGWLFCIARNQVLNHLRHQRRHPRGSGDSGFEHLLDAQLAPHGNEAELEQEYRRQVFLLAAESIEGEFTAATWRAFWQTAVEERPIAAVATELGMSSGAVYIARSRVLARLRQWVQAMEGGE